MIGLTGDKGDQGIIGPEGEKGLQSFLGLKEENLTEQ